MKCLTELPDDLIDLELQVHDITDETFASIRRVECTVDIPDDLYGNKWDRFYYATRVADGENGLPDWVRPCNWELVWNHPDEVRIARESRV